MWQRSDLDLLQNKKNDKKTRRDSSRNHNGKNVSATLVGEKGALSEHKVLHHRVGAVPPPCLFMGRPYGTVTVTVTADYWPVTVSKGSGI